MSLMTMRIGSQLGQSASVESFTPSTLQMEGHST
jgi:hypothetical protein